MSFLTFWWSLGSHISIRPVGKPLLQEPSVSKYSIFQVGFFPLLLGGGQTLYSVVVFPCLCQRHRASYNFSPRKEEVDAYTVHVYTFKRYANQPRPHARNCRRVPNQYFTFRRLRNGPQTEWIPLDQTQQRHRPCPSAWHGRQALSRGLWRGRSASSAAAHVAELRVAPFSCRRANAQPEGRQSASAAVAASLHLRLLFRYNTIYGFSYAAKKSRLGKKGRKNFSSASRFE